MNILERFTGLTNKKQPEKQEAQLLAILDRIRNNKKIYTEVIEVLTERNPEKFKSIKEVRKYIDSVRTDTEALGLAKLIDGTLGEGTYRTMSFLDSSQDAERNVSKLVKKSINRTSFEKQVERGYYLNLLESYGVSWDIEKVSRDSIQNFFDANRQTLDGISITVDVKERDEVNPEDATASVLIEGPQDYDWRELAHFGGTTKKGSETEVGGFGEGIKIASFVLLRDYGAKEIKISSRDWEVEYYFSDVASDSYREAAKGLHMRKRIKPNESGNNFQVVFEGENAAENAKTFERARELFFGSDNPDFKDSSFDNKDTGGFKVLAPRKEKHWFEGRTEGNLYLAGQRTHYDSKDSWATVNDLNIWTWKKIQVADRDRGMVSRDEMKENIIPFIVNSMSIKELKRAVFQFTDLWGEFSSYQVSYRLLEAIVERLVENNIKLEFEKEYLAEDLSPHWVKEELRAKGYKTCCSFLAKIGMRKASEQFREWQSHIRIEETEIERKKIELLRESFLIMGFPKDEEKEVWVFDNESENSPMHGQYNTMFFWMAREVLSESFLDAIHTYVHEAAHKHGPHGDAKFDYTLQDYMKRIQAFQLERRKEWDDIEQKWSSTLG